MFFYIYKITADSGKYYIVRHSTKKLDDGYMGSGKWSRSIKNKSVLKKEILEFVDTFEDLLIREQHYINQHIENPLNMNFSNQSIGFGIGDLHPSRNPENKKRMQVKMKNDNPMHKITEEKNKARIIKIKESTTQEKNHFYGKKHTEETKLKMSSNKRKFTEEGKRKLSESRKKQIMKGEKIPPSFKGKKHTEEYKKLMSEKAKKRKNIICEHCNISCKPHLYSRWHGNNCKKRILVS